MTVDVVNAENKKVGSVDLRDEIFGGREGTLQNFAGVVWGVGYAEAPGRLRGRTLADFKIDPEARRRYLERFVGGDDGRSSHRVLDVIERPR